MLPDFFDQLADLGFPGADQVRILFLLGLEGGYFGFRDEEPALEISDPGGGDLGVGVAEGGGGPVGGGAGLSDMKFLGQRLALESRGSRMIVGSRALKE